MPDPTSDPIQARDLPIALYLNQRVTFDLLAALEGGFARVTTVQESSSDAKHSGVEGGLGVGNQFALLGLSFGAKGQRDSTNASLEQTSEELVHTPTSLFARLRGELIRRNLVKNIGAGQSGLQGINPGDFVEVQGVLRRSPFMEVLKAIRELASMTDAFDGTPGAPRLDASRRQSGKSKQRGETSQIVKQVDTISESIAAPGSEDLIVECGESRFVLTTELAYFVDPTMNDVIDGTFRIFGKVSRVVPEGAGGGISLFRKSPLKNFDGIVEKLESAFASLPQAGFTGQKVETEIPAPTLQLIPIGIFA